MKFFWKKNVNAKTKAGKSAESRTGRRNKGKATPKPEENINLYDSRCGRKALEKIRRKNERSKRWTKKRIALITCLAVVISLLAGISLYIYDIWSNPMDQFDTVAKQFSDSRATEPPTASKTGLPSRAPQPTQSPTKDPYENLVAEADLSILNNTVNIMLIGVDYAQERDTWNGKHAYHADVMIVLSINTITDEVNLISLPRDTYAKIPDVDGIYKLNASIDCGGGWPSEGGFKKVCEAASWMLGGLPVQYYYAVDMSAVKGLVDSVGGVDFDMDIAFNIQERSYKAGMQHMDGQAVLDYLRVRKNLDSESGDLNRINRQKRMLVAIFEKIKSSGMLANLPKMLDAFNGSLYTNTTLGQTAGLAAFFYKIDSNKIELHSMDGDYHSIFNWSFVITDQDKRVKLIKDIYGIDVPVYKEYTYSSASHLWEQMQSGVIASKSKGVLKRVYTILKEDEGLPVYVEPTEPPATQTESPETSTEPTASSETSASLGGNISTAVIGYFGQNNVLPASKSTTLRTAPDGYRKYGADDWNLYNEASNICNKLSKIKSTSDLRNANTKLKSDIEELCRRFGIARPGWRVNYETNSNEIYVDFR